MILLLLNETLFALVSDPLRMLILRLRPHPDLSLLLRGDLALHLGLLVVHSEVMTEHLVH